MTSPQNGRAAAGASKRVVSKILANRRFDWQLCLTWALILSLSFSLLPQIVPLLHAQAAEPTLTITGVDVTAFPEVKVTVYGEKLENDLAQANINVQEDGVAQTITASPMITVGTQTLLVLDSYAQINSAGLTKDPSGISRKDEVVRAVQRLTAKDNSAALTIQRDWLAFVSFDHTGAKAVPQIIKPWNNQDHNEVINGIVSYDTKNAKTETPLSDLLFTAVRYFKDSAPLPNLQRSIVVFSDGFDFQNIANQNDIIREANDLRVRIHTVQVGSTDSNAQRFLQNLSLNTGGQSFRLDAANKLLDPLWQAIKVTEQQRAFAYRTTKPAPQQITVSTKVGASQLEARFPFPVVSPGLPKVTIVQPADNTPIERKLLDNQPLKSTTPLTDLEPKILKIAIELTWPENHARNLKRVEFSVNDKTVPAAPESMTTLDFPIDNLDNGDYTIRVRVIDELGLVAESDPKPLTIVVNRPKINAEATAEMIKAKEVTATLAAQATATVIAAQQASATVAQATATAAIGTITVAVKEANWWRTVLAVATSVSSLVALAALILVVILWRNPRVRKRATEFASGTFKAATEIFVMGRSSSKPVSNTVKARLRYEEGSSSSEQTIDLYGGTVRIGRDPALVNITLNDRRISRLHCRITEEANGTFRLWDEGSSSGTYVNQEQVGMSGRILQLGDVINIGPVQYRFEPLIGGDSPVTEISSDMYGDTQPYILTPNMKNDKTKAYDAKATQMASFDDTTAYDNAEPYPGAPAGSDDATKYYSDDTTNDNRATRS